LQQLLYYISNQHIHCNLTPTYKNPGSHPNPNHHPTPIGGGSGQIAFASNQTGVMQIYLINVDGTNLIQVTDMPSGACQPAWAPVESGWCLSAHAWQNRRNTGGQKFM
jgi:hypothetical protein